MATCKHCDGTGEWHYTLVEMDSWGCPQVRSMKCTCTWCGCKGQRKTVKEIVEGIEEARSESLGTKNSR